jgi:hypothetical protein
MDKEELNKIIKETNNSLHHKTINFGTVSYMILKTLELKEKGVNSSDFEKLGFNEELE